MIDLEHRMPAYQKMSITWHIAGAIALIIDPSAWAWVLAALVANHALIALAGLLPRAQWLGPCRSRLLVEGQTHNSGYVALTFDDGPDPEVTTAVLKILEARGAVATFFPIGSRASAHRSIVKMIAEAGHRIGNHSWSHSSGFFFYPPRRLSEEIDKSQDLIEALTGDRPTLFRAPAGIRSPLLQPLLERRSLTLTAWSRRGFDTADRNPARVLKRLTRHLKSGDILLLHDGSCASARDGRPVVLHVLPQLLDAIEKRGLTTVTLH